MNADSKHPDKEYRKNRRRRYKGKENGDFAINKELPCERIRLRMVYNGDIQDFDKPPKCAFMGCPYEPEANGGIIGHMHKRNGIRRKGNLLCAYCPPSPPNLYTLTRRLYGASCPNIKRMIQMTK